jgi:hypothetical protein
MKPTSGDAEAPSSTPRLRPTSPSTGIEGGVLERRARMAASSSLRLMHGSTFALRAASVGGDSILGNAPAPKHGFRREDDGDCATLSWEIVEEFSQLLEARGENGEAFRVDRSGGGGGTRCMGRLSLFLLVRVVASIMSFGGVSGERTSGGRRRGGAEKQPSSVRGEAVSTREEWRGIDRPRTRATETCAFLFFLFFLTASRGVCQSTVTRFPKARRVRSFSFIACV